jgi:hypothetical protein
MASCSQIGRGSTCNSIAGGIGQRISRQHPSPPWAPSQLRYGTHAAGQRLTSPSSLHMPTPEGLEEGEIYGSRGHVYFQKSYKVGVIFSAPLHEAASKNTVLTDFHVGESNCGPVYTKVRKFVVVACFASHIWALPIYTHNGNGLSKNFNRDEFVSIRDVDEDPARVRPAESKYRLLFSVRTEELRNSNYKAHWNMMSNYAALHLARPICHKYETRCTFMGKLKKESLDYLLKNFKDLLISKITESLSAEETGPKGTDSTVSCRKRVRYDDLDRSVVGANMQKPAGSVAGPSNRNAPVAKILTESVNPRANNKSSWRDQPALDQALSKDYPKKSWAAMASQAGSTASRVGRI